MLDTLVIRYKTLLMQRLLDLVHHGYRHYTAGEISATRAQALCDKFQCRYEVGLSMNQRAYRKAQGHANARLILADLNHDDSLHWFLMVTDGEHAAHALEKLKDALTPGERIHVSGYELLRLPHSKAAGGTVRLTWRMTHESERQWRYQIRFAFLRSGKSAPFWRRTRQGAAVIASRRPSMKWRQCLFHNAITPSGVRRVQQ
jgi:hypothetical protein